MRKYFFITLLLLLSLPLTVTAADIYFMPVSLSVPTAASFVVRINVDSQEEVNAIDAEIFWDSDKLTLQAINNGGSIFDLWVKDLEVNQSGNIRLLAGATKAFVGQGGKVVDLIFRTKDKIGQANFSFGQNTRLLRADGQASLASLRMFEVTYDIAARPNDLPVLVSNRLPDENKWYSDDTFDIHWPQAQGWAFSYLLSRDPTQQPDKTPEDIVYSVKYEGLADGIYYFQLLSRDPNGQWLGPVTRRAMIDTTKPDTLEVAVAGREVGWGVGRLLSFQASDAMSGIDYYQLKDAGNDWQTVVSPHQYDLKWLDRQIAIRAVDKAGNYLEQTVVIPGLISELWWLVAIIVLILLATLYYLYRRYGKKDKL